MKAKFVTFYRNGNGRQIGLYTVTGTSESLNEYIESQVEAGIPREAVVVQEDSTLKNGIALKKGTVLFRSTVVTDSVTGKKRGGYYGTDEITLIMGKNGAFVDTTELDKANLTASVLGDELRDAFAQNFAKNFAKQASSTANATVNTVKSVDSLEQF